VVNDGPSDATGTTVALTLPAGLRDAVVRTADGTTCPVEGTTATCPVGALADGERVVIALRGRVPADAAARTFAVTAAATAAEHALDPADAEARTEAPATGAADLAVTQDVPSEPIGVGETTELGLTVTSGGPSDATGVTLTATLPDGLELVADQSDERCSVSGQVVTCALGTLAPNTSATPRLTVRALRAGAGRSLAVDAGVRGTAPDPDGARDRVTTAAPVRPAVDLTVEPAGEPVIDGTSLTYRLVVTNHGPNDATQVRLEDLLPEGATYVAVEVADGACTYGGRNVACDLGTMPVGARRVVVLKVQLGPSLAGQAFATAPTVRAAEAALVGGRVAAAGTAAGGTLRLVPRLPDLVAAPVRCTSRRAFDIRVRRRAGQVLTEVAVVVRGRTVRVVRGRRHTARIDLRGLPRGTFRVRIRATTRDGRKLTGIRTYHTCIPKIPTLRPPAL
jgi:uncharacterized repeat protein (TIGR01451 family)